ncbi:hypothetical protein EJ997_02290 [Flaviflexus ciconiae]|uniref:Glycerate kinase n=1 Tax=Flaviflexus ciconiae TaxID=2496867 RepID=A0A3Q9G5U9_9ACTO|nr:glycerate kinase [Flaviflexus ciconiae]AZQ76343.1 hypothetical protein EJ997_02290 [Flaviflexus ciconiae]
MNILLTATRVEGAPASVVLDAAAGPWKERADVDSVPVSDGEGDLCEVLAQLSGGELGAIESAGVPVPSLVSNRRWVLDLSQSWGENSRGLGVALTTVLAENPSRLVLNLPRRVFPDLGEAMLEEMGFSGVEDLATAFADVDVLVTCSAEQPLLGVNGLPRWLDRHGALSALEAQELEKSIGGRLPRSARQSLLSDDLDPKSPTSGIGGGAAMLLQAAGARTAWAGDVVAGAIAPRLTEVDLVVYVTGEIGLDLPRSLFTLADHAEKDAIPVIVIYGEGRLQRHELARFGLSGSYSYAPEGVNLAGLARAMGPISQTWART